MTRSTATGAPVGFERRRHSRLPISRPVRLEIAGVDDVMAVTANLSSGGLFVECPEPPPVGTRVRFALDLGARAVRGHAEVAWLRLRYASREEPRGMGLRILFVLDDGARELTDFLAEAERDAGP